LCTQTYGDHHRITLTSCSGYLQERWQEKLGIIIMLSKLAFSIALQKNRDITKTRKMHCSTPVGMLETG
jgi:hypothetical protein